MSNTIVGLFDDIEDARQAEQQLLSNGFPQNCVKLHAYEASADTYSSSDRRDAEEQGGFMQSIRDIFSGMFGDDHEDVGHYSEAVRRGGVVLSVMAEDDSRVEAASEILSRAGAENIDNRVSEWRESGYSGFDEMQQPYSPEQIAQERNGRVIPVIKEELEVGKRQVDLGAVRVYSHMVETPVSENIDLREQHASINRRPVDRPATDDDLKAFKYDSIEIREMAEKAVVSKNARVVEEVEVDSEESSTTETINDTVRNTEVEVERQNQRNRSSNQPNRSI